ncbi:hypothetical protein [Clostridium magnum]|uniref:hypothetical protein n=1 Tax=Clostridium magnum TaxID=33954 RepID=UPI001114D8E1|nr:hypothetical protein [Clostridium magnum]
MSDSETLNYLLCRWRTKGYTTTKEKGIEIFRINSLSDLKTGCFGILEPSENCSAADSSDIDLILMPGVSF